MVRAEEDCARPGSDRTPRPATQGRVADRVGGRLDTYANNLDNPPAGLSQSTRQGASRPAVARLDRRAGTGALRSTIRRVSVLPRVRKCGCTVRRKVGVGLAVDLNQAPGSRVAGFRGLYSCASVWACPRCSAVIGVERAAEIRRAVDKWRSEGAVIPARRLLPVLGPLPEPVALGPSYVNFETGELHEPDFDRAELYSGDYHWEPTKRLGRRAMEVPVSFPAGEVVFLTLTLRHNKGDRLSDLWDALSGAFESLTRGSRIFKDRVHAYTRSAEVTHGANGWHVHLHCLLFVSKDFAAQLRELAPKVFKTWRDAVAKLGFSAVDEGQDMRLVSDPEKDAAVLAAYVTKNSTGWDAAQELTASMLKRARGESMTPRDMLAVLHGAVQGKRDALTFNVEEVAGLYSTFERASHGRRQLTWSVGAREALCGDVLDDEELAAAVDEDDALVEELDQGTPEVCGFAGGSWRFVAEQRHGLQFVAETMSGDDLTPLVDWVADRMELDDGSERAGFVYFGDAWLDVLAAAERAKDSSS